MKGQGMWGCERVDCTTDIKKAPSGHGKQGEKRVNKPREDEGIDQSKLRGMGTMGGMDGMEHS
jgi:hypothetical protein